MVDETDYRKFYDDEEYLLEVGRRFRKTGNIDAADFYMLLIWKANRAKNYHRDRLKHKSGSFQAAVSDIASEIFTNTERKVRLQILMEKWVFALPTATAILALLYPDDFTVYDWRVCGEVGRTYKPWLGFSAKLWNEYEQFIEAVIDETPQGLTLRDRDRFLIGRSIRKGVEQDCKS
jgi:hypothetical protein